MNNLAKQEIILLNDANSRKTSVKIIKLNLANTLTKKILSLVLTKQAIDHQRWIDSFSKLEKYSYFVLLFGGILNNSGNARDIDLLIISEKKNFKKINTLILEIQKTQSKDIHAILLTAKEFQDEIKSENKSYLDALKKGVVLFGQDNFIENIAALNGN